MIPEKWCIDLFDASPELISYVNANGQMPPYHKATSKNEVYAHFPSPRNASTTFAGIQSGYTEITPKQFEQHILNKKKIKGYVAKEEYIEAVAKILDVSEEVIRRDNREFGFTISLRFLINQMKDYRVLDLWFDPIYEDEKPKIEIFVIGNPARNIIISKGIIKFSNYSTIPISEVKNIYDMRDKVLDINGAKVFGSANDKLYLRSFWFGCKEEGTEVRMEELGELIKVYERLNS